MMFLDPGPLARALFHFDMVNPLVVLVNLVVMFVE